MFPFSSIDHCCDLPVGESTVNQNEVAKFSRLAGLWWDETGEVQPLHAMNELRSVCTLKQYLTQRHCSYLAFLEISLHVCLDSFHYQIK